MIEIKNRITGAVLHTVDAGTLRYAYLSGADLSCASLSRADLSCASLSRADLSGANLSDANLSYADLRDANLSYADLSGANLSDANLSYADLSCASLSRVNLSRADTEAIKADVYAILNENPNEVAYLRQALIDSKVDGSTYKGECCCLVGTIANAKGCDVYESMAMDTQRRAERWFLAIAPKMPIDHPIVALTLAWVDEWIENNNKEKQR